MSDGRRTELIEGAEGPRLAKVAIDEDGRWLIAQEAGRLGTARHPGVVEMVHHEGGRLEAAWAGDRTLEVASLDLDAAAALLAAVTATVADLHDLGVVHGRLDPSHVIVGPDGSPRLCGMSGPRSGEPERSPADDVAALGRLIHRVVGHGVTAEPIPERRWRRRRWSGYQQRALQNLADQAQADDADRRPSARTLATSIAQVAPDARLARPLTLSDEEPTTTGSSSRPTTNQAIENAESAAEPTVVADGTVHGRGRRDPAAHRGGRLLRAAVGVSAALTALLVVTLLVNPRSSHPPSDAAPIPRPVEPQEVGDHPISDDPTAATPTTTASSTTSLPTGCTPVVGRSADIDADGCPDPVVIDGNTITAGDAVFRAGDTDDQIGIGDWRCTGHITPGIVRPSTGEVFLFDRWPNGDDKVEVEAVAIVPGGQRLVAHDSSCGPPAVESAEGTSTQLTLNEGTP